MVVGIFIYIEQDENNIAKTYVVTSFVSDLSKFFAESDYCLWILRNISSGCAIHNIIVADIINF